jgi:hypothetical protein
MVWIHHESGEQTVIKNGQALGPESPLETDEAGYAEVEDEDRAALLTTLDPNVVRTSEPDTDDDEFDAAEFVDRTPMDVVIDDIESGDVDDHLEAIKEAADREGVQDAVSERRE